MFDWLWELLGFESDRQRRLRMERWETAELINNSDYWNPKAEFNRGKNDFLDGLVESRTILKPKQPKSTIRNESTTPKSRKTGDDDSGSGNDFSDTGGVDISKWISHSDSSSHSHSHSYDSGSSSSPSDSGSSSSGD